MAATVLESPRPGRDPSKIVQTVFPIEDEAVSIEVPGNLPPQGPIPTQRRPKTPRAPKRTKSVRMKIETEQPTVRDGTSPSGMTPLPVSLGPESAIDLPTEMKMVSIKHLKGFASKLGPQHPLRLIMLTEPDEITWDEYTMKAEIWWRLLALKED